MYQSKNIGIALIWDEIDRIAWHIADYFIIKERIEKMSSSTNCNQI
jgi:hypothetical protein